LVWEVNNSRLLIADFHSSLLWYFSWVALNSFALAERQYIY